MFVLSLERDPTTHVRVQIFTQVPFSAHSLSRAMGKEEETGGAYAFVDSGPPPDLRQRELIFDSFSKIVGRQEGRQKGRGARRGQNRGAFCFTWGAGYHGQLGRKFIRGERKFSPVPVLVETDAVVRQVTCGGLHSAMVTEHGEVFTWGEGNQGQVQCACTPSNAQA